MNCNMACRENAKVYSKGLCRACYNAARNLVKSGKTTWVALEAAHVTSKKMTAKREFDIMRKVNGIVQTVIDCAKPSQFLVGQVVKYDGESVKIIAKHGDLYEIQYAESGSWIGDDIPHSELS